MAYITLSRLALFHNLDIIAQYTGSADKIAIVLKDNAYGHGLQEMAKMASEYGLKRAVVRTVDEADQIRGFFSYILVLADIPETPDKKICYTINTLEQIPKFPKGCRVELKVDTGMHRNGIAADELEDAFKAVSKAGLQLEALFTHNRSADTLSSEWFWQRKKFEMLKVRVRLLADRYGFQPLRFHSSNSATLFRCELSDDDMVRIGIAAYGCLQMDRTLSQPLLKPVLSLWGEKITTRVLKKNQRLGYNGIYTAKDKQTVSTYDIGYADGLLRSASDHYMTPDGAQLLGRISMDNSSFSGKADELLIFDNANIFAKAAGTIGYEVLTGMRPHTARKIVD